MSMRLVAILVLIFAFFAWDMSSNNGYWFSTVNSYVDDVMRAIGLK